jgi:hypothetical protein
MGFLDILSWANENHESVRSLALACGAILALLISPVGVYLNARKTTQLRRQNDISTAKLTSDQSEWEHEKSRVDFVFGVNELSQPSILRRQSGLFFLDALKSDKRFGAAAQNTIFDFINARSLEEKSGHSSRPLKASWIPADMRTAMNFAKTFALDIGAFDDGRNLNGAFLPFADLATAQLTNSDLRNADLTYASFTLCNMDGADMSNCDASGAKFRKAQLNRCRFVESNLSGADFRKANISKADFSGADLRSANLPRMFPFKDRRKRLEADKFYPIEWDDEGFYQPLSLAFWQKDNPPTVDPELQFIIDRRRVWLQEQEAMLHDNEA